jgi:beta-1,4-mannosyltransferase
MLHSITRDPRPTASRSLRVASVPSSHVYVRHLSPAGHDLSGGDAIERLADPVPSGGTAEQSQWWPPAMLEAGWVADHADEFDVFHVHFGFDARSPAELQDVVEALRIAGRPLVFTVHDLRNPHHTDRRAHDDQLDVLVPAADQLITLTEGAAREIWRRWGRDAVVIPHPHVVDLDVAATVRRERASRSGPFRVGLHVKSLRACMDAAAILPGLVRAVQSLPDAVLQVNGHRDVLEPGGARYDASLAGLLADLGPAVDLRVHDFFTDDELWAYLGSLDASVLPYRHGTHSGWLEACRDLGTSVVAPTCGHYADQAPVHSFVLEESEYDEESLVNAVRAAHDRPAPPVDLEERRRQREAVAAAHRDVYTRLVRG